MGRRSGFGSAAVPGAYDMDKIRIESFGELFSDVARAVEETDRAVHVALEHQHSSRWHSASTAPYNYDLELRVTEDGVTTTLPFPCRHTNADEWINVDLGVPLQIRPVEWRAWQHSQLPHPYQSSILGPEGWAVRRREQWSGCHEDTNSNQAPSIVNPEA